MRVFQTLLAFGGNAQPQLAVTRRLLERGHEVRVLAHSAARGRVEDTGAGFVPYRRAQPDLDMSRRERDTLRDWQARTRIGAGLRNLRGALFAFVLDVSRDCAEALASWPADVVVYDWMLTGAGVAAQGARVPAVALVHCPYPFPVRGAPPPFIGLRPMAGPLGSARDRLLAHASTRVHDIGVPLLNRARTEHGLAPLAHWGAQLLGADAIEMLTAHELDFSSAGALPANVHYVGPAFEPYPREWRSPWPHANADPLVVISLSTSYMNQRALVQRILDAVAGLPVRALLTAGPALETDELRIPANARAVAYVPHRTVFPHASLVITHAGWQTINAALADGVPLVCIPDRRDQPDNAARVLAVGAGVRVRKHASPRRLRAVIARALEDPSLRRGAQAMARALARSDGARAVVARLERLTAAGGAARTA
ncbi:MAG TPA: nucleotide disphospho-sugar-binding domain-containing protein [Solirubrobacteraceae bacterium]|nr:nucleotide disphospho-sugar-binding domain-containing protein [Solirubrobacteraceae bacterium]